MKRAVFQATSPRQGVWADPHLASVRVVSCERVAELRVSPISTEVSRRLHGGVHLC